MNCTFFSVDSSSLSIAAYPAHSITLQRILSISSGGIAHSSATSDGTACRERFRTMSGVAGGNHGRTMSAGRATDNCTALPVAKKQMT
jgi:hypothetical protein